jgi:U3 small nucleolar RNA-associated protein 5
VRLPEDYDAKMDDVEGARADGALDTEMAELTLGQRLKAITGEDVQDSSSDESESGTGKRRKKKKGPHDATIEVPTESLSRTLIQALHSGDTKLLEACLRHSDSALIRNTVRRVPQQLAVPLLTACVERLGRGR